jgi:hypothetical protein
MCGSARKASSTARASSALSKASAAVLFCAMAWPRMSICRATFWRNVNAS